MVGDDPIWNATEATKRYQIQHGSQRYRRLGRCVFACDAMANARSTGLWALGSARPASNADARPASVVPQFRSDDHGGWLRARLAVGDPFPIKHSPGSVRTIMGRYYVGASTHHCEIQDRDVSIFHSPRLRAYRPTLAATYCVIDGPRGQRFGLDLVALHHVCPPSRKCCVRVTNAAFCVNALSPTLLAGSMAIPLHDSVQSSLRDPAPACARSTPTSSTSTTVPHSQLSLPYLLFIPSLRYPWAGWARGSPWSCVRRSGGSGFSCQPRRCRQCPAPRGLAHCPARQSS